ncbi:hypothetical protein MMC29_003060 [Sticta canariensis]|nr:hypothetical protein [Sticta canariensis]
MDPVGCSASILTLAGTALVVGKIGADLVQAFQDAPQELRATVLKIRTIQVQLEQLTQIGLDLRKTDEQLLSSQFSETIQSALESSMWTLKMLQKALPSIDAQNSNRSRLRWLFLERTKVNQHSQRLQYVQQDLKLALQILDMRITLHLKESVSSLCGMQSQLSEKVDFVQQKVEEICVKMPCTQQKTYATDPFSENSASTRPYFEQPTKLSDYAVLKKIGILGTMSSSSSNNETSNALSVTVSFPWLLGCRAITVQFLVKWLKSSRSSMQLSRGILSVRNVVSDESRIMVACEQGGVPVVQQLLQTKRASPHDITATGRTPLLYAIKSGNIELVKLLLDNDAEVNQLYGDYQMCLTLNVDSMIATDRSRRSPFQLAAQRSRLDIARILLSKGAWTDHTDARGWTAAFYLWSGRNVQMPSQTCFLKFLNMDGQCDLGASGCHKWTALHRAAALGTAEDVEVLIRYGAEPGICTEKIEWSPLYYSILYGNEQTLRGLINSSQSLDINSSDSRGWTPFHVAATFGVTNILASLLDFGADPYRLTKPTSFDLPEALQGKALTPLDIANESGQEQYNVCLKALHAAGFENDPAQATDTSRETELA